MTDWPTGLKVGPIRDWPGTLRTSRTKAPFTRREQRSGDKWPKAYDVPFSETLALVDRELRFLNAKDVELLVAIPAGRFRIDGRPYADAKAEHPGVILSFTAKVGALSYPCDTFTTWQDNVRAIALALEALRKVDRYGVTTHGEQYRGFLALEGATAAPAGFVTGHGAAEWLNDTFGEPGTVMTCGELLRRAKRATHPDLGGDVAKFQRVSLAEAKLREEGLL